VCISMSTHANDHMSIFVVYSMPSNTSGALKQNLTY
jgi:hypothetical protein